MDYFYWQGGLQPGAPYTYRSPNISAWLVYILARFGGSNLGSYVVRPRTGTTNSWSTHAFGAAWDWGYTSNTMRLLVINFLIEHHQVLGVQMIVDEGFDRTWKVNRGWKAGNINGGSWLHIETTPVDWFNATPVAERLTVSAVPTPPPVLEDIEMIAIDYTTPETGWTAFTYTGSHLGHTFDSNASAVQDAAGVKRVSVTHAQLQGLIKSTIKATPCPPTLDAALTALWG